MNIDLTRLNSGVDEFIEIDINYSFTNAQLENTEIQKLDNVLIKGEITRNTTNDYNIYLKISGIMVLPCSLTLKPVNHKFEVEVDGILSELLEEIDENSKNIENSLDIFPIVWENILMEIPMKVVSEKVDIPLSGDGWKFITEEEKNTPFADLKDMLK